MTKYLGIIIDHKLNFHSQFNTVYKKLCFASNSLHKNKNLLSKYLITKLYSAYVLSTLEYCSSFLFFIPPNKLNKLTSINNKLLNITILNHNDYNINCRLFIKCCKFLYHVHNDNLLAHFRIFRLEEYT